MRREACKLAKELAQKNGGKPSEYMGEAWARLRKENPDKFKSSPKKKTANKKDKIVKAVKVSHGLFKAYQATSGKSRTSGIDALATFFGGGKEATRTENVILKFLK
ncbi:hypothetical protein ACSHUI_00760 [Bacillus subtilis]|uniref:hypothetical protein n=1 Tax=Bacillus subtilis TaxID=1423 RepID=UPI0027A10E20|nr:hypothetical protein Goe26_00890 [Bacillus phage vB_BsuM-Goe26]